MSAPDSTDLESALIVPVRAADANVATWRDRLDPSASLGVPAHITVMSPFVPPGDIDDDVLAAVADIAASVPAFPFELTDVRWFERRVAWLAPDPAEPFRALTEAVMRRWPELKPYGRDDLAVIPHLTIGTDAPIELLREATTAVGPGLPIQASAEELWIMVGTPRPGTWTVLGCHRLAPAVSRD